MSDPTIEEESLISQDDIDKLLDSSSIEEAEDLLSDDDDLGELSQDDIDSLMNSNSAEASDSQADLDMDDDDDMELISQDDIDSLMNASDTETTSAIGDDMDDGTDDDLGELSQDDIDSLMNPDTSAESAPDPEPEEEAGELSQDDIDAMMNASAPASEDPVPEDPDDDDFEMISQDDINSLMSGQTTDIEESPTEIPTQESEPEEEAGELSQDDIDAMMNGNVSPSQETESEEAVLSDPEPSPVAQEEQEMETTASEPAVEPEPVAETAPQPATPSNKVDATSLDDPIDDSEAVTVEECKIAQETIDDLIENFDSTPEEEPVVLEEKGPKDEDRIVVELPDGDLEPAAEAPLDSSPDNDPLADISLDDAPMDGNDELSLDDSDDLLGESSDDLTDLDFGDEDVSQDDIDALLMESDEEEDEDDILISQDDIDTLLMAADQDDEDVLGDMMDDDLDSDFDDEDILENENENENAHEDEEDEDQVVLEGDDDEEPVAKSKKKESKKKTKFTLGRLDWLKSKVVIACGMGLLFLGIAVPAAYFVFFRSDAPQTTQQITAPVALAPVETQREVEIETVNVQVQNERIIKKPGNMLLKDFVIIAPEKTRELAYITADISIDYSDKSAYYEIMNNLSLYRDLIYDALNKSLMAENSSEVTEADMLGIVETTLKKMLPGDLISRVTFKSFKVG